MAISGMVYKTEREGNDLIVFLAPVERPDGATDPVGQEEMRVENFTWIPLPGDIAWGGSDQVIINSTLFGEMRYRRVGYTKLAEAFE